MAGETTAVASTARKAGGYTVYGGPGETMSQAFSTTQNETNDVMEMGYLPAGVKVLGFIYVPTDMDTGTALVHKITVGSTDVATGLTGGQTGAGSFVAIVPYTTTAPTKVTITSTTAASTAAAGTVYLTPVYAAV
jgi:hypothetical protein